MRYSEVLEALVKTVFEKHNDKIKTQIRKGSTIKYVELKQDIDDIGLSWQENTFVDYRDGRKFAISSISRSVDRRSSQVVWFSDGITAMRYILDHNSLFEDILLFNGISHDELARHMQPSKGKLEHDIKLSPKEAVQATC